MAGEDDSVGAAITADSTGAVSAFDNFAAAIDRFGGSMTSAGGSFATMGDAANATIIPTRAAHQELNLVTKELAGLAGMTGAAEAPLRVLDATLYSLVATGGAINPVFLLVTAAIVGITAAFESSKKSAEEEAKGFDALIAKNESFIGSTKETAQSILDADQKMIAHLKSVEALSNQYPTLGSKIEHAWSVGIDALQKYTDIWGLLGDYLSKGDAQASKSAASIKKIADEMHAVRAAAEEMHDAEEAAMLKFSDDQFDKQLEKLELWEQQQVKASLAMEAALESEKKGQLDYQIAMDKRYQDQDAKERAWFGLAKTDAQQYSSIMSSTFQQISSGVGQSFAKMVVEGKNFGDSMKQLGIDVAEELISKFVAMGLAWAAMNVYKAATSTAADVEISGADTAQTVKMLAADGMLAESYANTAAAKAAIIGASLGPAGAAGSASSTLAELHPFVIGAATGLAAVGADFIADEPTHLLVGEGGQPERVMVTPMSQSGGAASTAAAGTGGLTVNFGDIIVQGIQNPRDFADQVALLITQSIRGRAQLNMTGRGIF